MIFSILHDISGSRIDQYESDWPNIVDYVTSSGHLSNDKHYMSLFKVASFGDKVTAKGSKRFDANVITIYGIEVDYDAEEMTVEQAQIMLTHYGIEALIYTSPSHKPDKPRWRVVCPTSVGMEPSKRRELVGILNSMLGGCLADESFTLSQSYYFGRLIGAEYKWVQTHGRFIDQFKDIPPTYPAGKVYSNEPVSLPSEVTAETIEELKSALSVLDPDMSYPDWTAVGQNLKCLGDIGFELWNEWSMASGKYDPVGIAKKWSQLAGTQSDHRGIFSKATVLGWANPKKRDLAKVFGGEYQPPTLLEQVMSIGDIARASYRAGQFVAGGLLDEIEAEAALSVRCGGHQKSREIFIDQFEAGKQAPRYEVVPTNVVSLDTPLDPYEFQHRGRESNGSKIQKPQSTFENLQTIMQRYGFNAYYDEVLKQQFMTLPIESDYQNDCSANGKLQLLKSVLALNNISETLTDKLSIMFMRNTVNPIYDYITGKPWDGIDRITPMCNTVGVDIDNEVYRNELLNMWFVQCIAAMDGAKQSPIPHKVAKYESVLVLQGGQGVQKTTWLQSLVPSEYMAYIKTSKHLDIANKDTVKDCISGWITELGELDATFRKSDVAALKGFLSQTIDIIRLPYERLPNEYQRRTSMCASVNEKRFLVDNTGNRRFLPLPVNVMTIEPSIDRQQFWAQVWLRYINGCQWWPDESLKAKLINRQDDHSKICHVEESLKTRFDLDNKITTGQRYGISEILNLCGLSNNGQNVNQVKSILENAGFEMGKTGGKRGYRINMTNPFGGDTDN